MSKDRKGIIMQTAIQKSTLTRSEAAERLNVSLPVLDAWLRREANPLPCFRAGRKVLIPTEGLSRWIEEEATRSAGKAFGR